MRGGQYRSAVELPVIVGQLSGPRILSVVAGFVAGTNTSRRLSAAVPMRRDSGGLTVVLLTLRKRTVRFVGVV